MNEQLEKLRSTLLEWRENALNAAVGKPMLERHGALGRADGYENAVVEIDRILGGEDAS